MRRLDHWLRPFPQEALLLDEVPWYDPRVATVLDARVYVPTKRLAAARDRAAGRALVFGLAHLYWPVQATPSAFSAGARDYIATRTIHDQFAGTHYFTIDWLGGFASYAIRPVVLTRNAHDHGPPVRHFPETTEGPDVRRVVDALFTLEQYIGWPTLQYAVSNWLAADPSASSVEAFEQSLAEASGRDLRWFTRPAFDREQRFDYALSDLTVSQNAEDWRDVAVTVSRLGAATFPVEVLVVFDDGTRIRERWNGRDANVTFKYRSRAPATAAIVDPDLVLLLDEERANNVRVLSAPWHVPGVRWTLQWATWLQNVLLTTTAFI
jgi:hypothetical protein